MRLGPVRLLLATSVLLCMAYNAWRVQNLTETPSAATHIKLSAGVSQQSISAALPGQPAAADASGRPDFRIQVKPRRGLEGHLRGARSSSTVGERAKSRSAHIIHGLPQPLHADQAVHTQLPNPHQPIEDSAEESAQEDPESDNPLALFMQKPSPHAEVSISAQSLNGSSNGTASSPVLQDSSTAHLPPHLKEARSPNLEGAEALSDQATARSGLASIELPPEGQTCEAWLKEADASRGGRDFEKDPITVWDFTETEVPGCGVPCIFTPGDPIASPSTGNQLIQSSMGR